MGSHINQQLNNCLVLVLELENVSFLQVLHFLENVCHAVA